MSDAGAAQLRRRQIGEAVVVLGFLALAGLVFYQTRTSFVEQDAASGGAMFNAAMFPQLLGWCLVLLAALRLIDIVRIVAGYHPRAFEKAENQPLGDHAGEDHHGGDPGSLLKALVCAAIFMLYLLLLKTFGYHLMTPLFMFACFYMLGTRRIILAVALAVGTSLAMSFVFEYWMSVILPVGMFGIGF